MTINLLVPESELLGQLVAIGESAVVVKALDSPSVGSSQAMAAEFCSEAVAVGSVVYRSRATANHLN